MEKFPYTVVGGVVVPIRNQKERAAATELLREFDKDNGGGKKL